MKHVVPPPEMPEPPWLDELRGIEDSISKNVRRYIRWVKLQAFLIPIGTGFLTGLILHLVLWYWTRGVK